MDTVSHIFNSMVKEVTNVHEFEEILLRDSKILDEIEQLIKKQEEAVRTKNIPPYIQLILKGFARGKRVSLGFGLTGEVLETRRDNTTLIIVEIDKCKEWLIKNRDQIEYQRRIFKEVQAEVKEMAK